MKKSAFALTTLTALLVVLIVFYTVYRSQLERRINSSNLVGVPNRTLVLPDLDLAQVEKIHVQHGNDHLTLVLSGERWTVKERSDYPASFSLIRDEAQQLSNLKTAGRYVIGKTGLGDLGLLPPGEGKAPFTTGRLITLYNGKGDVIKSLVVGDPVQRANGASARDYMASLRVQHYVHLDQDKDTVWLIDDDLSTLVPDPAIWLDKAFISVQGIKSVAITALNPNDSWIGLRNEEGTAYLLGEPTQGDSLDTAKAVALNGLLQNALFYDVVPKDKVTPDFMRDAIKAKISTFDGFVYDLEILKKKDDSAEGAPERSYITLKVQADLPATRKAPPGEAAADKKRLDEDFAKKRPLLEKKLAHEKQFEGWVFVIANDSVDILLKKRSEVIRDKDGAVAPSAPATSKTNEVPEFLRATSPAPATPPAPAPATPPTPAPATPPTPAPATPPAPAPATPPAPAPATPPAPEVQ